MFLPPPPKANAQPIVFQTKFGPGSPQLQFNIEFPFDFGFNPDSLYTMTLHFFVGSQVFIPGNNQTLPDPRLLVNIQPPGTVQSLPFGTLQVTDYIHDANDYSFKTSGPQIPEPATGVLLLSGGIALLGWRWSASKFTPAQIATFRNL